MADSKAAPSFRGAHKSGPTKLSAMLHDFENQREQAAAVREAHVVEMAAVKSSSAAAPAPREHAHAHAPDHARDHAHAHDHHHHHPPHPEPPKSTVMKVLEQLDQFAEVDIPATAESHKVVKDTSHMGVILTVLIAPLLALFVVVRVKQLQDDPFDTTTEALWTVMEGPFPVTLACYATSGCWVNYAFSGLTDDSAYCADALGELNHSCQYIEPEGTLEAFLCYSSVTWDAIRILYEPETTVYPETYGVTAFSEVQKGSGTLAIRESVMNYGKMSMVAVHTRNESHDTSSELFSRYEYFGTQLDSDSSIWGKSNCLDADDMADLGMSDNMPNATAGAAQMMLLLQPQYTLITVVEKGWFELFGEIGGAYGFIVQAFATFLLGWRVAQSRVCKSGDVESE